MCVLCKYYPIILMVWPIYFIKLYSIAKLCATLNTLWSSNICFQHESNQKMEYILYICLKTGREVHFDPNRFIGLIYLRSMALIEASTNPRVCGGNHIVLIPEQILCCRDWSIFSEKISFWRVIWGGQILITN